MTQPFYNISDVIVALTYSVSDVIDALTNYRLLSSGHIHKEMNAIQIKFLFVPHDTFPHKRLCPSTS